jgi:hypothetical protein
MAATKKANKKEAQEEIDRDLLEARLLADELGQPLERVLLDQLRVYRNALRVTRASLHAVLRESGQNWYAGHPGA